MFDLLVHAVAGGAHAHLLVAEHGAAASDPTSRVLGEKAGFHTHKLDLVGSQNEVYDRCAGKRLGRHATRRGRLLVARICARTARCVACWFLAGSPVAAFILRSVCADLVLSRLRACVRATCVSTPAAASARAAHRGARTPMTSGPLTYVEYAAACVRVHGCWRRACALVCAQPPGPAGTALTDLG
jgi:hypothetical protein